MMVMDGCYPAPQNGSAKRSPYSCFRRTVSSLLLGDAALMMFLTYGYVFPSRMSLPEMNQNLPEQYYDYSAKSSPFQVSQESRLKPPSRTPIISARSMPLVASAEANEAGTSAATLEQKRIL